MKMRLIVSALLIAIVSCSTTDYKDNQSDIPLPDFEAITGEWKEYWAEGQETNVTYNDIYLFTVNEGGALQITCPERKYYRFVDIYFDGSLLETTLLNENDPKDIYIIKYIVRLDSDGKNFIGTASTNKGVNVNIRWERGE